MADQPPSYESATQPSGGSSRPHHYSSSTHLDVPSRNGIPARDRRSMEDEGRSLPPGWVRQYDAKESHQYFVDTNANPPRSIWQHPYDDEGYLSSLSMEERETLQAMNSRPSTADVAAESSADDSDTGRASKPHHSQQQQQQQQQPGTPSGSSAFPSELPDRPQGSSNSHQSGNGSGSGSGGGLGKIGLKMKDKMTGSTHEERERNRQRRAEEEAEAYRRYVQIRTAMTRAVQTGQPQFLGKNTEGRDIYMEPPRMMDGYSSGSHVYPGAHAATGRTGIRAYDPYAQGPYANSNNRFVAYPRPNYPYGRPRGYGYGGGMGVPLMGGVLGGMALGGLMF